jgi:hypothetical protein
MTIIWEIVKLSGIGLQLFGCHLIVKGLAMICQPLIELAYRPVITINK